MSQADELLNSLQETIPEHLHDIKDDDGYFTIDPNTREVVNISSIKTFLMQGDHNSEIFTIEVPRYVERHDMMLCNVVKAHYNNIGSNDNEIYEDVADLSTLEINPDNPDTVICTWTISRYATQYAGILSFLIQYICKDENDNEVYEWHSDIYDNVEVKQGRNNSLASVMDYTDILEQWRARLFGSNNSVMADIKAEGEKQKTEIIALAEETLITIPGDCKVVTFDIVLKEENWIESEDKTHYYQVIDFEARDHGKIDLHPTAAQLICLINDGISMFVANENGLVTMYAIGGIPSGEFTISAMETVVIYA